MRTRFWSGRLPSDKWPQACCEERGPPWLSSHSAEWLRLLGPCRPGGDGRRGGKGRTPCCCPLNTEATSRRRNHTGHARYSAGVAFSVGGKIFRIFLSTSAPHLSWQGQLSGATLLTSRGSRTISCKPVLLCYRRAVLAGSRHFSGNFCGEGGGSTFGRIGMSGGEYPPMPTRGWPTRNSSRGVIVFDAWEIFDTLTELSDRRVTLEHDDPTGVPSVNIDYPEGPAHVVLFADRIEVWPTSMTS